MRFSTLFLAILVLLAAAGCGADKTELERLAATVNEQDGLLREREVAAQQCEDLFDAERQRNDELERLIRMRLPISMQNEPVIDAETIEGLPEDTQVKVEDQIQAYQAVITREFDALIAINRDLKRTLEGLGTRVRVEARLTRDAGKQQAQELRSELGDQKMVLEEYLAKLNELSAVAEELINQIQAFNEAEIACLDCWRRGQRKAKKDTILRFNSSLVRQLTQLQTEMTAR